TRPSAGLLVNKVATTITLSSAQNPSLVGQSVGFSATLKTSAGVPITGTFVKFTFTDPSGVATLGGGYTDSAGQTTYNQLFAADGTYSAGVSYDGDTTYAASSATPVSQVVNKVATTITLSSAQNP